MVFIRLLERLQSMAPDVPDLLTAGHIGQWADYYLQPPTMYPPVCVHLLSVGQMGFAPMQRASKHPGTAMCRLYDLIQEQQSRKAATRSSASPRIFVDIYMAQCFHAVLSMRVAALCVTNVCGDAMQASWTQCTSGIQTTWQC